MVVEDEMGLFWIKNLGIRMVEKNGKPFYERIRIP